MGVERCRVRTNSGRDPEVYLAMAPIQLSAELWVLTTVTPSRRMSRRTARHAPTHRERRIATAST
jgi:hypothetical protein